MSQSWRDHCRPVIAEAITSGEALGLTGKDLARHVSAAYCFGQRKMHPYKIWLSEVALQMRRVKTKEGQSDGIQRPLFDGIGDS